MALDLTKAVAPNCVAIDQSIAKPRVIAFAVIVLDELANDAP